MDAITEFYNSTPLYLQMLMLFGVALLGAVVSVLLTYPLLGLIARRWDNYTLKAIRNRTRTPLFWMLTFLLTVSFWAALRVSGEGVINPFYLNPAIKIARTIMYIFGALLVIRLVTVAADTVRHRFAIDDKNNLRERKILTQLQYIQKVIGIVVFLITAAFILLQFESVRNVGTGLFTSVGVGGLIIGIAAQKSIANLLAGFQIAFTQPIRIDDALIVNGEYGWVEEITLTYVVMRLWDERRQIVPLQHFIDNIFQNWTRSSTQLTGTVFLYMDYTFPVDELRAEVDRFLSTQELWDERVKSVVVTDNNDKVQTIRILASSDNAGNTFNLRCALREHVIHWAQTNYPGSLPRARVDAGGAAGAKVSKAVGAEG